MLRAQAKKIRKGAQQYMKRQAQGHLVSFHVFSCVYLQNIWHI